MSHYIPEENVVMILKSLPVKSLLRFRCVCKWWKQLIDSPSFVQEHLSLQKPSFIVNCPDFLSVDPRTAPPTVETLCRPVEHEAGELGLVGTLHGVVCLYDDMSYFHFWNPSIRKVSSLHLPRSTGFIWCNDVYLNDYSAFWIDPYTKDVKIIAFNLVNCYNEENVAGGVLYSSSDSSEQGWFELPTDELIDYGPFHKGPPVMIDGVAYWRARREIKDDDEGWLSMDVVILCFDFVQERLNVIETPHLHVRKSGWYLPIPCKWKGTLSLVYWQVYEPSRCDIYLRHEDLWVKMFGFNLLPHVYHVFWASEETEERFRAVAAVGKGLVLYDSKDGCVDLKSGLKNALGITLAYDFVESLLFPS